MPVQPSYIKELGEKIYNDYNNIVSSEYQHNKDVVDAVTNVESKTVRNRVAGLVTRKVNNYVPEEEISSEEE